MVLLERVRCVLSNGANDCVYFGKNLDISIKELVNT